MRSKFKKLFAGAVLALSLTSGAASAQRMADGCYYVFDYNTNVLIGVICCRSDVCWWAR